MLPFHTRARPKEASDGIQVANKMSLSQRLQQKQSQSLVITPQLAQSIKLLQYSHAELIDYVREEVEKNPLLELDSQHDDGFAPENRAETSSDTEATLSVSETGVDNAVSIMESGNLQAEAKIDASFDNVFDTGTAGAEKEQSMDKPSQPALTQSSGSSAAGKDDFDFLANVGEAEDLVEYLERQIVLEFKSEEERNIATYIAHGLDEDGYFKEDLDEVALQTNSSADIALWVLERFHSLEPVGIAARDLAECLTLQLKELDRFDPAMETLINNLALLARREFPKLMELCGVDREDFVAMIDEIKALDPRPARSFEPVLAETVVPDIIITSTAMGDWNIELNPETLPRVIVDRDYHVELSSALKDTEGHQFVTDCLDNANWLTQTLDQRAHTILKVSTEIMKRQDRFFTEGSQYLKPLTLKAVADAIKMHESTVSRVTSNKYLHCDRGTFELKYFFSSAISAGDGEEQVSSEAVKYQIQQMINTENTDRILSDEQIVNNLQETGIEIARRTVAKYREALNISSSIQRRREKTSIL